MKKGIFCVPKFVYVPKLAVGSLYLVNLKKLRSTHEHFDFYFSAADIDRFGSSE